MNYDRNKLGKHKMPKAILVKEYCQPDGLYYEDIKEENPGPGQVGVAVQCAGVNFPDCLIIQGKYQFQPPFPFSPGGELSGIITKLGEGVEGFKIGDPVIAMTGWGAYSEYVLIDAFKLVKIPKSVDFKTAAGVMMTYGTSYHALKQRAKLQPGETVLVLGAAGGVGLAAVELAKVMGAKVIAAASTDDKLQTCKKYGADHLINYSTEDLKKRIKEITDGNGVDVVYDPVGDKYAEPSIRSMAWKGRYLVIGFAAGQIPKIPLNLTLLKGCSIVGVFWGNFTYREPEIHAENTRFILDMVTQGKLKPLVTQTYALKNAGDALSDMMQRKIQGKAIILCSPAMNGSKI